MWIYQGFKDIHQLVLHILNIAIADWYTVYVSNDKDWSLQN